MTKREYKIHVVRLSSDPSSGEQGEQELNELGASGWEMVAVLPGSGPGHEQPRAFLKRQKAPVRL